MEVAKMAQQASPTCNGARNYTTQLKGHLGRIPLQSFLRFHYLHTANRLSKIVGNINV